MGARRRPSGNSELIAATGRDNSYATHVSVCLSACAYTRRMSPDSLIDSMVGVWAGRCRCTWAGVGEGEEEEEDRPQQTAAATATTRQLTYYVRMGGVCARRVVTAARVEEELDTLLVAGTTALFSCWVGTTLSVERHQ